MKYWMNDVVLNSGVKFPYKPEEFITDLKFSDKAAHLFFELEDQMTGLLKRKLW